MSNLAKLRCLAALSLVACYNRDTPTSPQERALDLRPPSTTVVVDSFSVLLGAEPADSAIMHTYPDAVYAEIRVAGTITLRTNPVAPNFFPPVNNTNGPVYAYGSFVSGGSCGLNVTIRYTGPGYYGTSKTATPCDQQHEWTDTLLVQGSGRAIRGGPFLSRGRLATPCRVIGNTARRRSG